MPRPIEIRIDQTGNAQQGISALNAGITGLAAAAGVAAFSVIQSIASIGLEAGKNAVEFGISAIEMAADAREMASKFDVVFGDMSDSAGDFLDKLATDTGRSKFALREMAATIQDTFVPLGFAREEASGLSQELVQLAVDVGSFNNVAAEDVMEDFQSAIVGNTETVRKYGIVITQVQLNQELLNMGVAEGVKGATELEKAQARVNLIFAGTTDAQGDAIRTADSWANTMVRLTSMLEVFKTTIGDNLINALSPLLAKFAQFVQVEGQDFLDYLASPKFQEFVSFVSTELVTVFDDFIERKIPVLLTALGVDGLEGGFDGARGSIGGFVDWFTAPETTDGMIDTVTQMRKTLNDLDLGIASLNLNVQKAILVWYELERAVTEVGVATGSATQKQVDEVTDKIVDASVNVYEAEQNYRAAQAEHDAILQDIITNQNEALAENKENAWIDSYNAGVNMTQGFKYGIEEHKAEAIDAAHKLAVGMSSRVKDDLYIHSPSQLFYGIGVDVINGWINGLNARKQSLFNLAASIAAQVATTIANALQIQSPSKVMEKLGEQTIEGYKIGMEKSSGQMLSQESKFMPTININNPSIRSDNDIKGLTQQVIFEMNKMNRTYRGGFATGTV